MLRTNFKQFKQKGIALFVSLMLLLILTIIAVSAMKSSMMEVRMADNFYNRLLADEGAETATRAAESWLSTQAIININNPQPFAGATAPYCTNCNYATQSWAWFSDPIGDLNNDGTSDTGTGTQTAGSEGAHVSLTGTSQMATISRAGGNSANAVMTSQPVYILAYNGFDIPNSNGDVQVLDPELRTKHIGPHYYISVSAAQDTSGNAHSVKQATAVVEN